MPSGTEPPRKSESLGRTASDESLAAVKVFFFSFFQVVGAIRDGSDDRGTAFRDQSKSVTELESKCYKV